MTQARRWPVAVVAAAMLLAACGGSDGGGDPAPPPPSASDAVPDSARQNAAGLVAWLRALVLEGEEAGNKAPLDVSALKLPVVDDAEPLPVR